MFHPHFSIYDCFIYSLPSIEIYLFPYFLFLSFHFQISNILVMQVRKNKFVGYSAVDVFLNFYSAPLLIHEYLINLWLTAIVPITKTLVPKTFSTKLNLNSAYCSTSISPSLPSSSYQFPLLSITTLRLR